MNHVCPRCGYCDQCGRSNPQPLVPRPPGIWPAPWYQPTTPVWPSLPWGGIRVTC